MNALLDQTRPEKPETTVELVRARPLLGTMVEISATGSGAEQVLDAIERAFNAVETVHRLMSYQDPESDVSSLNRMANSCPVQVSGHTWHVLETAQKISEASGGLFDITVAPTLTRLGFLPKHDGFPKINGNGDWRHVELLPGNRVRFARKLRIDLSGIAKGYAADLAAQALKAFGMAAGRVNAGGDMRMFGAGRQSIHVRAPGAHTQSIPLVELACGAVATSAGYYASRRHKGARVTSLVDPLTRTACKVGRSVTVLAGECMIADALTKIVHVDPARANATLNRFKARALIVETDLISGGYRVFDSRQDNHD